MKSAMQMLKSIIVMSVGVSGRGKDVSIVWLRVHQLQHGRHGNDTL